MRYYFSTPRPENEYNIASAEDIQKVVAEMRDFPHLYTKEELWFASLAEATKQTGTVLLAWWCGKPNWAVVPRNESIREAADAAMSEDKINESLLAHGVPPIFLIRDLALIRFYETHKPREESA